MRRLARRFGEAAARFSALTMGRNDAAVNTIGPAGGKANRSATFSEDANVAAVHVRGVALQLPVGTLNGIVGSRISSS